MITETESEHQFKKWSGTILAVIIFSYGIVSIILQNSYFITEYEILLIEGTHAILQGVALMGFGLALFSHFYMQYSEKLFKIANFTLTCGLLFGVAGQFSSLWFFVRFPI